MDSNQYALVKLIPVFVLIFGALSAGIGVDADIASMAIIGFACVFVGAIGVARIVWDTVKK